MGSENYWCLYRKDGYKNVETELNNYLNQSIEVAKKSISDGVKAEQAAEQVRDSMYAFMDTFTSFGTRDTEPEAYFVTRICDELNLLPERLSR